MIGLLRAEAKKVSSIRMTWVLIASGVVLSLIYVLTYGLMAGQELGGQASPIPGLENEMTVRLVYSSIAMGAYVIAMVIGIVMSTSEIRYRTSTVTYLVTPDRWKVVSAKYVVALAWGAVFALIDLAICLPTAILVIGLKPHWQIPTQDLFNMSLGTVIGFALYAALGVALGALVKNQIGAIVGALSWVMIVESVIVLIFPGPGKWLPGGAMGAMAQTVGLDGSRMLEPVAGGLLLLAYSVVLVAAASLTTVRSDVS